MDNQRYLVFIVRPPLEAAKSTSVERMSFLIPFSPLATVTEFIETLWERLSHHGHSSPPTPDSYYVDLHLGDAAGPIIDVHDVLSEVIHDPWMEKIFAVFKKKLHDTIEEHSEQATASTPPETTFGDGDQLSVRIITPSSAQRRDSCPILKVGLSNTVRHLHSIISGAISFTSTVEEAVDVWECNCTLAAEVAIGPSPTTQFLLIHGKSVVERMPLAIATKESLEQALSEKFGPDLEEKKSVTLLGEEHSTNNDKRYTKTPVVSICSKQRHISLRTCVDLDEAGKAKSQVLDLHTSELPIHPACFEYKVGTLGLQDIATDGIVDIFVLPRLTIGKSPILKGKSAIFHSEPHWEPSPQQSDRGMANFLSTLRVFTYIVQDMEGDEKMQDAVLYVFELLTQFPPALRCLHILIQGKTPTIMECAALSQATLAVLDDHLIIKDRSRLFEGSRLIFGYILQTAKLLRNISEDGEDTVTSQLRYGSAFLTVDLYDHKTREPTLIPVMTNKGLMEECLFRSLQDTGVLATSHVQSFLVQTDIDPSMARVALQNGGTCSERTVYSVQKVQKGYYDSTDAAGANDVLDLNKLGDLGHLAEMCGRNNLAVHRPSQLVSAVTPRLSFDCNAHLAVYTGEKPCAVPGKSSIIFRPQYGEETIDPAVLEQLIAPIIKGYEKDSTAVFDVSGGAEVRQLQNPDEILVFCVDSSSSMGSPTDFEDAKEDPITEPKRPSLESRMEQLVEAELNYQPSLDDTREKIVSYESFNDILGIVADARETNKAEVTGKVLDFLTMILSHDAIEKSEVLERMRRFGNGEHRQSSPLYSELMQLILFWAGIKKHKESLRQFLRWRATCAATEATRKWTWSCGDPIPSKPSSNAIPALAADITELPYDLRCPISHNLMEDAVKATDGHTYSRSAISQWLAIRKSSPLHGAPLDDISLIVDGRIRDQVARWISGTRIGDSSNVITVVFDSRVGSFSRTIDLSSTAQDLYKLAYRGLLAKFEAFQLSTENFDTLPPTTTTDLPSLGLQDGDHITIHLPDDADALGVGPANGRRAALTEEASEMCLVKVYLDFDRENFSYWIKKDTNVTLTSVIWKFWRHQLHMSSFAQLEMRDVITNVTDSGDNWYASRLQPGTNKLAQYLARSHCTGMLKAEKVYSETTSRTDPKNLVLKVLIRKPETNETHSQLTRLDVLKQLFEALINRMLAYNYNTHVGLVEFASEPKVVTPITHVLENFRRATNELSSKGDTALWDALALAADQIKQYATKYPDAKKRIIVISDGEDTKSIANTSHDITSQLLRGGVSVDSICLGNQCNIDLRTLSYLLGSYVFSPTSLTNALTICEMEPFLSLTQRPPIRLPLPREKYNDYHRFVLHFRNAKSFAFPTVVTGDRVPPIKEHPNIHDEFVQLKDMAAQRNGAVTRGNVAPGGTGSRMRVPRLLKEMKAIAARAHPKYDVYVSTTDVSFWKVVMEGPDESPYSEGAFLLYLHADNRYPSFAPNARFVTKIKHPNVNAHGRVCHSIFDRDWTSDTSMAMVLDTVYGLLFQPEHSDRVNTAMSLGYQHDQLEFADEVRKHVRKHASRTRESWKALLLLE